MRRLVEDGDRFLEVAPGSQAEEGCDIELTAITIDRSGDNWWSLGLEAFGPADHSRMLLSSLGAAWFAERRGPPLEGRSCLDLGSSKAYPAWLAGLLVSSTPGIPPTRT